VTEKAGPGKVSAQDLQFIVEGIRPVPKKLVEKARLWQFINIAELLPSKSHGEDDLSRIKQAQADGQVVLVHSMDQVKKTRKDIPDILSWVEAFGTLVATVAMDQPPVQHMMSYMLWVIRAARVNGSHWQDFDREFRLKAAVMGNWKWSTHDADLWDYHVTAVAAVGKGPSQSGPSVSPYG